ncbi:MAG TPA: hypothetical protein VHP31_12430 [Caproicibacter sp.]|nr:hypothetical protein [Caproicibacter sp.]
MKNAIEYKVSFRVETNRAEANPHTRTHTQRLTIPLMTLIGTILPQIIKTLLQHVFSK